MLQDNSNPWRAYIMQQRGETPRPGNANGSGVRARDITFLPLSDSSAKMKIYATYDSVAGSVTKIRANGDYQFCAAAPGKAVSEH
jgi:hypothetical protein